MDICLLHIDKMRIGLPMDSVREVLFHPTISPVPASPSFFMGVTSFRGQCLPVVELPTLLACSAEPATRTSSPVARSRVVVTQCPGAEVGIQVDLVGRIEAGTDAPPNGNGQQQALLLPLSCSQEPEAQLLDPQQLEPFIVEHTHPFLPAVSKAL